MVEERRSKQRASQMFSHDPMKWDEFKHRYWAELDKNTEALEPIESLMHKTTVSLLYSTHDLEHNNAIALKEYLDCSRKK